MESMLCSKVTCSANSLSFHRNNNLLGLDERWRKKSIQQIVSNSGRSRLIFLSANKSVKSNITACSSPYSKPPLDYLGHHVPDDDWTSVTTYENSLEHHANELDGEKIANEMIKSEIESDMERMMKNSNEYRPRLAIVLVGKKDRDDDDSSQTLVRLKNKAREIGIDWCLEELSAESTEDEIENVVSKLNRETDVHGVIQLPLPEHMDDVKIMNFIDPKKDVDGFHPDNMWNLALKGREPFFIPCSAKACIHLLLSRDVKLEGKNVVVMGRSKIVALSTFLLLQRHQATVSLVNSFTKNPQDLMGEADIVITDMPDRVCGSWLKPGTIVIDVGRKEFKDLIITLMLSNTHDAAKRSYERIKSEAERNK